MTCRLLTDALINWSVLLCLATIQCYCLFSNNSNSQKVMCHSFLTTELNPVFKKGTNQDESIPSCYILKCYEMCSFE